MNQSFWQTDKPAQQFSIGFRVKDLRFAPVY